MIRLTLAATTALLLILPSALAGSLEFSVAKTKSCGCCKVWIEHLNKAGHQTTDKDMDHGSLTRLKLKLGLKADHMACHTAQVAGYVIEGHVPVADIERLVAEKPEGVIGLAVPGMPTGSPGMEFGTEREAYDVLAIHKDGTTSVWSSYEARK